MGPVYGIVYKIGTVCSDYYPSVGLTGTTLVNTKADVASTAAHELGHLLDLWHTDGRKLFMFSMLQG